MYIWKQVTMAEACIFMQGKTMTESTGDNDINWPDDADSPSIIEFTDNTAVAAVSQWEAYYSEYTPDIDARPPLFWIGIKNQS